MTSKDLIPKDQLRTARRIVVKLGTNVICRPNGEVALGRVSNLIEEISDLKRNGKEVIVVTSGSISLGMEILGFREKPESLSDKQACAAVGQIRLMEVYQKAFESFNQKVAQVLLTDEDFSDRNRYLNLRNTLNNLIRLGTIPIVNENDTISTSEIETQVEGEGPDAVFGDNDVLSALVASKLKSDILVVLSDVNGLFDSDPSTNPNAQRIQVVRDINDIDTLATCTPSPRGRGGMKTKLRAAHIATQSGVLAVIAKGAEQGVLHQILNGEETGTYFLASKGLNSRKSWLAFATQSMGIIEVNEGAKKALQSGRASLLFAGVLKLERNFDKGEIVSIVDIKGIEFARGQVNYSSVQALQLIGEHSSKIAALNDVTTDDESPTEFIHRDNIVFI